MEILSTGQKIKRVRIYKGITLKELCSDGLSISKMSCIENGKIKADTETLKYISKVIGVDYDYLVQDAYEQIEENYVKYKKITEYNKGMIKDIEDNIFFAKQNNYYNLAFDFYHLLFRYYLSNNIELCDDLTKDYYDIFKKVKSEANVLTYYFDMGAYLYYRGEYVQASIYYSRLINMIPYVKFKYLEEFRKSKFNIAICYYKANQISKAYDVLKELIDTDENESDEVKKVIYKYFALTCIKLKDSKQNEYIMKYENIECKRDINICLRDKLKFAEAYFYINDDERAKVKISEAIKEFDKEDTSQYVLFLGECMELLIDNKQYEEALVFADDNLNSAIIINDIKLIEKAYYIKGCILQGIGNYEEADRYFTLSLDSLFKYGTKNERYKRHMDMGLMYFKLGQTKDSIKHFNFALQLSKTL